MSTTAFKSSGSIALLVLGLLSAPPGWAQPSSGFMPPFRAVYALLNGDKTVGESIFTLRQEPAAGSYVFETRSEFRGLLRMASPRPVVERSAFTVVGGVIRPTAFSYEDGSRRGRRNVVVHFDWERGQTVVIRDGVEQTAALEPLTLDRASVRIALMRELAAGRRAGSHKVADPDLVRDYAYRTEGIETVTTPLGSFEAYAAVQERAGSSRRTVTWSAPELEFLPVRIEQQREDRDPVAFVLEAVEWLDGR